MCSCWSAPRFDTLPPAVVGDAVRDLRILHDVVPGSVWADAGRCRTVPPGQPVERREIGRLRSDPRRSGSGCWAARGFPPGPRAPPGSRGRSHRAARRREPAGRSSCAGRDRAAGAEPGHDDAPGAVGLRACADACERVAARARTEHAPRVAVDSGGGVHHPAVIGGRRPDEALARGEFGDALAFNVPAPVGEGPVEVDQDRISARRGRLTAIDRLCLRALVGQRGVPLVPQRSVGAVRALE